MSRDYKDAEATVVAGLKHQLGSREAVTLYLSGYNAERRRLADRTFTIFIRSFFTIRKHRTSRVVEGRANG